ncbi:hypothetical protein HWV62_35728 [Athelia sp. TMB]|nr:hypothetical protein HWV62_35728 [Athelia sp. TMB]
MHQSNLLRFFQPQGRIASVSAQANSNATMPPRLSLPPELFEDIILQAWIAASETFSRWAAFKSFCLVSKAWRAQMIESVFQFVVIRDAYEMDGYEQFVLAYGHPHPSHTRSNGSRFSKSEVYLYLGGRHLFCAPQHSSRSFIDHFAIAKLIPDARSMTLFIHETADWANICFDTHRPSLKHLHIWYMDPVISPFYGWFAPPDTVPTVTHLHISRACRDIGGFFRHFPNVTHLRLSAKGHLKSIASLTHKVVTLIIDAPPTKMGGKDYTSLLHWNFRAAFNDGLLSPSGKTIIINTDGNKPAGWEAAAELCAQRGIEIVQNIIYDVPPPRFKKRSLTWDQILNDGTYLTNTPKDPSIASRLPPSIV